MDQKERPITVTCRSIDQQDRSTALMNDESEYGPIEKAHRRRVSEHGPIGKPHQHHESGIGPIGQES